MRTSHIHSIVVAVGCCPFSCEASAWTRTTCSFLSLTTSSKRSKLFIGKALSNAFQENDLVAIELPSINNNNNNENTFASTPISRCRLCVVLTDGHVAPLCQRQDDVPTDLYLDPDVDALDNNNKMIWESITDEQVRHHYGEGWYGQRPIPSLGGGPGYGAPADDVWSVSEDVLEQIQQHNNDNSNSADDNNNNNNNEPLLPMVDVGMAHGEKARSGRGGTR